MPIPDKIAAANKINEFLQTVVTHGGLRLKYRIVVDPPLPENRDWEKPEILVDFTGPDSSLLLDRGAELLREQNVLAFDGLFKIALAEVEALAGDVDRAIAILDEALATSERTGHRAFEAELHRVRGEMLLRRESANPAPAEEALRSAIAVAKQQGTRSFELRAALSLAKLYQSTGRPIETHAILAPALEGFAPTAEMPEIAEAQALMERLA